MSIRVHSWFKNLTCLQRVLEFKDSRKRFQISVLAKAAEVKGPLKTHRVAFGSRPRFHVRPGGELRPHPLERCGGRGRSDPTQARTTSVAETSCGVDPANGIYGGENLRAPLGAHFARAGFATTGQRTHPRRQERSRARAVVLVVVRLTRRVNSLKLFDCRTERWIDKTSSAGGK